jgi:transposase
MGKIKEKEIVLSEANLEDIIPLLSDESYRNLQAEIKQKKQNPPPAENINYIPNTLNECQEKLRVYQKRLKWLRQMCFLYEISERETRKRNRIIEKENVKLKEENEELELKLKRTTNQLLTLLGIGKRKTKSSDNSSEKESSPVKRKRKKKRGAPKGHTGKTRSLPDKVDKTETISHPDICPHCGNPHIYTGDNFISKYIEDILPIVKTVIEKRFMQGICSHCNQTVIDPEALNGPPVKVGDNLTALLAILRHQMGGTYRKLSQLCTETLQIPLTPSGVLGIINRFSSKLEPVYKGIEFSLPAQPILHGDETGWKMDGQKWYLWCFCNKSIVYYHPDPSRGSKVPKSILGSDYGGVLHADFYAAYDFLEKTQRCLIHFQRAINEELEVVPDNKALIRFKDCIADIIDEGKLIQQLPPSTEKIEKQKYIKNKFMSLTKLKSSHDKVRAFIKRIKRYKDDLLRFLDDKEIEFHNNRAERAIRPSVVFRKISFGNRTPEGAKYHAILLSVLGTLRLKNVKPFLFIKAICEASNDDIQNITKKLLDSS